MDLVLALFPPGPGEMLVIGIVAVLLFGKRLPEVGRSLGKGLIEFKKGMNGLENEFRSAVSETTPPTVTRNTPDHCEATAPKFVPPTSESPNEALPS